MNDFTQDIVTLSKAVKGWQENSKSISIPNTSYQVFAKEFGDSAASSKRTLLLLHGFPESSYSYHKVITGLLEVFDRVVTFDMLGYGYSDKPDSGYSYSLIEQADVAMQVWRELGVTGGHVLSHDMGTSVLTELVARQAGDFLPAWFADGFHSYTFTNGSMALKFAKLRLIQKLLLSKSGALISKLFSFKSYRLSILSAHGVSESDEGGLSEEDILHLWENMTLQGGHKKNHLIIRYLNDRKRFEESRWLPALTATGNTTPVHFCWGDADQVARIEMARYLKNSICPSATLTEMAGAGHFCQLGSPELWLKSVSPFYQSLQN